MSITKVLSEQGVFEQSDTQKYTLGTRYTDEQGRVWVYSVDDGSGLTQYNTLTHTAAVGVDTVANGTASVIGNNGETYTATQQIVDAGAGMGAAGLRVGYLGVVDDGTGEGASFVVMEHPSTTTLYVHFNNSTSTGVTLAVADSDIEMFNPHSCKQLPANTQGPVIGVAPITVTASYYFWRQIKGLCFVLMTAANPTAGLHVVADDAATTAGTLRIAGANDDVDDVSIYGVCTSLSSASTAAKGAWVYLDLPC